MHSLEASDDTRRHRSTGTTPTGKYFTFERSDSVGPICHLRGTPVYGSYVSCAQNVRITRSAFPSHHSFAMPRNFRRTTYGTPESCISASNIIHGVLKRKESAAHRCTTDPRPQVVACDYRSAWMSKGGDDEVVFPEECCSIRSPSFRFACTDVFVCLQLDKVPHECVPLPSDQPRLRPYYFDAVDRHRVAPRVHDGAGTTGSSLRGKRYHYGQRGSFTRCHDSG
jgi:hypothetical protein